MQESVRSTITATFAASNAGQIHFGEVIGRLSGVNVESYHVDYRSGRAVCFMSDDTTLDLPFERAGEGISAAFSAEAIRAAIAGAQQGKVMYPEFKSLSQAAGCIGYTVWITGRHVSYFGRNGETHIERFPD